MGSRRARKRKGKKSAAQLSKARWLPNDSTRAQTFADRKKVDNKQRARGRSLRVNGKEDLTD